MGAESSATELMLGAALASSLRVFERVSEECRMPTLIEAEIAGQRLEDRDARWAHQVEEEDVLLILESMKMEIPVEAPCAGRVAEIRVREGDSVEEGDVLAVIGLRRHGRRVAGAPHRRADARPAALARLAPSAAREPDAARPGRARFGEAPPPGELRAGAGRRLARRELAGVAALRPSIVVRRAPPTPRRSTRSFRFSRRCRRGS